MTPLLRILLGVHQPGLVAVPALSPTALQLATAFNRTIRAIKTDRSSTKAELLSQFADDLALPEWFGNNLDAAHEALHDFLGANPDALICVYAPPNGSNDAAQFVDLINDVLVERSTCGLLVASVTV